MIGIKKYFNFITLIILISLIIRLLLIFINFQNPKFSIQQDGYADYASALRQGTINDNNKFAKFETRLFPGYPVLIFLLTFVLKSEIISGVLISLTAALFSIFLFWKVSQSKLATVIFAFFPPVWLMQSTKVATEPLTVFLLLLAILLFRKKYYFLTGLILGIAFDIRLISICLLIALIVYIYLKRQHKYILSLLAGFSIFLILFFIFNFFIFGPASIFRQFRTYYEINRVTLGAIQIVQDIPRALDWKQYRILISGLLYIIINFFAVFKLFKYRKISWLYKVCFYWMLFSLLFIFSLGPMPMLEEFSRFSVPAVPALVLGLFPPKLKNKKTSK
jgi:Gpi18-like mannosyltransferase